MHGQRLVRCTDRVLSRVRCRTRLLMRLLPLRSPRRLAPPPSLQPRPVVMVTAMTMSSRKRRRRRCAALVDSPWRVCSKSRCPLPLQVEFKPLVQLEEVKTANGEEDEDAIFKM